MRKTIIVIKTNYIVEIIKMELFVFFKFFLIFSDFISIDYVIR